MPYKQKDKNTLEWWEYDKLGTTASLGCVRLKVEDAKWIYNNCVPGTKVEFYSETKPGPLGKPTAKKITQDEEVRNWDPTDPDTANPWKEYLKKKESENKEKLPEENKNVYNNTNNTNVTNNKTHTSNNIINNNSNIQENIVQNDKLEANKLPKDEENIKGSFKKTEDEIINSKN